MLVVPADGTLALAEFLGAGIQLNPTAALFINNIIPAKTTTLADLTEASFPGYARQPMGPPSPITGQPDQSALMLWSPVIWSASAPALGQIAYGYYVVQLDATLTLRLLWLETGTPPVDWSVPGQNLSLSPQLAVQSLFG
jgi:hypothetical protein